MILSLHNRFGLFERISYIKIIVVIWSVENIMNTNCIKCLRIIQYFNQMNQLNINLRAIESDCTYFYILLLD